MDVDAVIDQLVTTAPADFTAARDEARHAAGQANKDARQASQQLRRLR